MKPLGEAHGFGCTQVLAASHLSATRFGGGLGGLVLRSPPMWRRLGGKIVFALGPGWRLHYFAHLDEIAVFPGRPVGAGTVLGSVGESGNARGRPPHLHYSILSLVPRIWRADDGPQGWKKMFYLDPGAYLP